MDRNTARYQFVAALALAATLFAAAGCRSIFTTVAYLMRGTTVDAEYEGLRGKKVAVVCRPTASLTFGNPTAHQELARQLSTLLRTNVSKIHVIDQQKIAAWTDENDWGEYPEVGKAMKADMVVGVDLLGFSLYRGQTLFQGQANVNVTVYDCANGGKLVYEKQLPQTLWPPNTGIATSEKPESQFRREFIAVLADQIGRHFYAHDRHADFARDADALH
jgi:hypothetical protein